MNICEGCIKQDVCKFKEEVEKYGGKAKLPEPLVPTVQCEFKRTEPVCWSYTTAGNTTAAVAYSGDCTLTAFNSTLN